MGERRTLAVSNELLRIARLSFSNSIFHNTYFIILGIMYRQDIYMVDRYLEGINLPPFSKLE